MPPAANSASTRRMLATAQSASVSTGCRSPARRRAPPAGTCTSCGSPGARRRRQLRGAAGSASRLCGGQGTSAPRSPRVSPARRAPSREPPRPCHCRFPHSADLHTSIEIAALLGVKRVVTMSGTPGGELGTRVPVWNPLPWRSPAARVGPTSAIGEPPRPAPPGRRRLPRRRLHSNRVPRPERPPGSQSVHPGAGPECRRGARISRRPKCEPPGPTPDLSARRHHEPHEPVPCRARRGHPPGCV